MEVGLGTGDQEKINFNKKMLMMKNYFADAQ